MNMKDDIVGFNRSLFAPTIMILLILLLYITIILSCFIFKLIPIILWLRMLAPAWLQSLEPHEEEHCHQLILFKIEGHTNYQTKNLHLCKRKIGNIIVQKN